MVINSSNIVSNVQVVDLNEVKIQYGKLVKNNEFHSVGRIIVREIYHDRIIIKNDFSFSITSNLYKIHPRKKNIWKRAKQT